MIIQSYSAHDYIVSMVQKAGAGTYAPPSLTLSVYIPSSLSVALCHSN